MVVAASLDEGSARIVKYLNDRDIAINVLCFQVFAIGVERFLSCAWLIDPAETQVNASAGSKRENEPWNGETYANFGHSSERSWSEAVAHGFISAGGGSWYTNSFNLLKIDDRIWVKAPGYGFVGVGKVKSRPQRASEFTIDGRPALDVLQEGDYFRQFADDLDKCEWFVEVEWKETVGIEKGVKEVGLFGNQNTVCKPKSQKWRQTVERLKQRFSKFK